MLFTFWFPVVVVLYMLLLAPFTCIVLFRRTHFAFLWRDKLAGIGLCCMNAMALITTIGVLLSLLHEHSIEDVKAAFFALYSGFPFTLAWLSLYPYILIHDVQAEHRDPSSFVFFHILVVLALILEGAALYAYFAFH